MVGTWNPPFFSLSPLEISWLYFHAWCGGQAPLTSCAVGKSSMDGCIQPFRSTLEATSFKCMVCMVIPHQNFLCKDLGTIIQLKLQPIYKWMDVYQVLGVYIYIYIILKMYNVLYFTYILGPFPFFSSRL